MGRFQVYWLLIFGIAACLELYALARPELGDTLSEQIWTIYKNPQWGKFVAWMLSAFLLWATVHFASLGRYA